MTESKIKSLGYTGVKISDGIFAPQIKGVADYYHAIPNDDLLYGFRKRAGKAAPGRPLEGWYSQGFYHVFGQILGGLAKLSLTTDDKRLGDKAGELLDGWLECMDADGYGLHNQSGQSNDPYYEYDKLMGGLVDCAVFLGSDKAKSGISRLTDWAIKNLNQDIRPLMSAEKPRNIYEWYTISENIYRAYQALGDQKYFDFAKVWEYPFYWDSFLDKDNFSFYPRHAYSHVNTLGGAAMAYRLTGEEKYLTIIRNAYDIITSNYLYATGGYGASEILFEPDGAIGESIKNKGQHTEVCCCSWAAFKLCRYLMEFTGDAKYAGWAEKILYNLIGAEPLPDAGGKLLYFANYHCDGAVKCNDDGRVLSGLTFEWPCCSGTMPGAIAEYANMIAFSGQAGVYLSQYINSDIDMDLDGQKLALAIRTSYPEEEMIRLSFNTVPDKEFTLFLRKPDCAGDPEISVNGQAFDFGREDGWLTVKRAWKAGDNLILRLPMRIGHSYPDMQHRGTVAYTYGPVALASDKNGLINADPLHAYLWLKPYAEGGPLCFRTDPGIMKLYENRRKTFKPFYRVGKYERYYLYNYTTKIV